MTDKPKPQVISASSAASDTKFGNEPDPFLSPEKFMHKSLNDFQEEFGETAAIVLEMFIANHAHSRHLGAAIGEKKSSDEIGDIIVTHNMYVLSRASELAGLSQDIVNKVVEKSLEVIDYLNNMSNAHDSNLH